MMMIGVAAWRSFIRNLRRYRVLMAALVLVAMALTAVLGILLGLQDGVRGKASRYFAGDLVVLGLAGNGRSLIGETEEAEAVERAASALAAADIPLRAISRRSTHYDTGQIEFYYVGYSAPQRRLVGVEWDREAPVLAEFEFTSGGVPDPSDERAVLISTTAARELGIDVGEELLVQIRSDRGRVNTMDLVVRGIYRESSFFGFTGYLHRRALAELREAPPETVNEVGVYLANPARDEERAAELLTTALENEGLPTFAPIRDRVEYSRAPGVARDARTYGIVTLSAQLSEIEDLLGAITIIAGVIILMFLGITVVGVSNTWTMVVWERTREIGTMRAMGMQRTGAVTLFLLEAVFLGAVGVIIGVSLGAAVLGAVAAWVRFEPNAFTTLFFTAGRLGWRLPGWGVGMITALVVVASIFGAARAAVRAGWVHPVEAMRQGR